MTKKNLFDLMIPIEINGVTYYCFPDQLYKNVMETRELNKEDG